MYNENNEVFKSLFMDKSKYYKEIVNLLCEKKSGYEVTELLTLLNTTNRVRLVDSLDDLEMCGFIIGMGKFGNNKKNMRYIISDAQSLFHYKWIKELSKNDILNLKKNYWSSIVSQHQYAVWRGFAFEMVCIVNIDLYTKAREMHGVSEGAYYWSYQQGNSDKKTGSSNNAQGTQIDIVVEYTGGSYDIVECKYYNPKLCNSETLSQ